MTKEERQRQALYGGPPLTPEEARRAAEGLVPASSVKPPERGFTWKPTVSILRNPKTGKADGIKIGIKGTF